MGDLTHRGTKEGSVSCQGPGGEAGIEPPVPCLGVNCSTPEPQVSPGNKVRQWREKHRTSKAIPEINRSCHEAQNLGPGVFLTNCPWAEPEPPTPHPPSSPYSATKCACIGKVKLRGQLQLLQLSQAVNCISRIRPVIMWGARKEQIVLGNWVNLEQES